MGFFDFLKGVFTLDSFYVSAREQDPSTGAGIVGMSNETQAFDVAVPGTAEPATVRDRNGTVVKVGNLPDLRNADALRIDEGRMASLKPKVSNAAPQVVRAIRYRLNLPSRAGSDKGGLLSGKVA